MNEPRWAETEREEVSGVVVVLASTCNNRAAWVEGLRCKDVQELLLLKINTKRPQIRSSLMRSQRFHLQTSSWSPSFYSVSNGFPLYKTFFYSFSLLMSPVSQHLSIGPDSITPFHQLESCPEFQSLFSPGSSGPFVDFTGSSGTHPHPPAIRV